ncbi:MAG: ATP-dependent helicase/nuclease subunit [Halanaerobiales bacterium]|nr:ATP-dependent helicase/nuclease subunit [Halanaerobiales bacterium]
MFLDVEGSINFLQGKEIKIDLVFKEEDGWVIVDYKTDRVEGVENLEKLKEMYIKQVKLYSRAWEKIVGEDVNKANVIFLSNINFGLH